MQQEFRLRSPVAVASVRGTSFEFDGERLSVTSGQVQMMNNVGQNLFVAQGESSQILENAPPVPPQQRLEQVTRVVAMTNPVASPSTPPPTPRTAALLITLPPSDRWFF